MVFKVIENGWLVEYICFWVSRLMLKGIVHPAIKLKAVTRDCFSLMQAEVDFLGQLHHPNLVKLIGYCIEDDQRLLVYEFMTRGSLENHLFRSEFFYFLFSSLSSC